MCACAQQCLVIYGTIITFFDEQFRQPIWYTIHTHKKSTCSLWPMLTLPLPTFLHGFSYINTFFAYLYCKQWVLRELLCQVVSSFLWNHLTCPASSSHCYHLECEVNFTICLVFCLSQNLRVWHFSEVQVQFRHNVLIWEAIFVCQQWKMRYKTTWNERSAFLKPFLKYCHKSLTGKSFPLSIKVSTVIFTTWLSCDGLSSHHMTPQNWGHVFAVPRVHLVILWY